MVRALNSGSDGLGSSTGQGHCLFVFLGLSLHPGVEMGTGESNARGNPRMDKHPIQGE